MWSISSSKSSFLGCSCPCPPSGPQRISFVLQGGGGGRLHRAEVLSAHQNPSLTEPQALPVTPALMCVPFFRSGAHLGVWARPLG